MRIAMGFLSSVVCIALAGCLNTNTDTNIDTTSEAITPAVTSATVEYIVTNDSTSASTISLDTDNCSPSTSFFPPFSISVGATTAQFNAMTTSSSFLLCTVRYQDSTGIQGCQFQLDAGSNFASANAYKGSGTKTPTCSVSPSNGEPGDMTNSWRGRFTMKVAR